MEPTEVSAAISAILPVLESLISLGLPGVLILLAGIPALVIIAVCILDYKHAKRIEKVLEAYRRDTQDSLRLISEKHEIVLRDMSEKHEEVAEFYRRNVTLVKNYERMTDSLQALVVNNTRATERLTTMLEAAINNIVRR